jgi:aldehyde:ferredoxin oxidoreductase
MGNPSRPCSRRISSDRIVLRFEFRWKIRNGSEKDRDGTTFLVDSIILANHLCELMGIDTITMGVTLAFVAECMERSIGTPINDALAIMVNLVTGWNLSARDLETMGERIYNVERLINVGRRVRRKDDTLPYRALNEPIPDGPVRGRYCPKEELEKMLDEYYALRGWTRDRIPGAERLKQLGLR